MSGLLLFAVVALVAFISKALKGSSSAKSKQIRDQTSRRFQQARERLDALRRLQSGQQSQQPSQQQPPWPGPAPGQPGQQSGQHPGQRPAPPPFHQQFLRQSRPQPGATPFQPSPSPYGPPSGPVAAQQPWQAPWAPVEDAVERAVDAVVESMPDLERAEPAIPLPQGDSATFIDLRDDPQVQQFLPEPEQAEPTAADPAPSVLAASVPARDIGSAALESTLDSTIESSLFGTSSESTLTSLSTSLAGRSVSLPPELETRVLTFLTDGHEVAAVRLICDELNCGLLDAMQTVHALS